VTNFAIANAVPRMILPASLDLWGTFLFFCVCCVVMAGFVLLGLPETKGVNLEDMEALFDRWFAVPLAQRLRLEMPARQQGKVRATGGRGVSCSCMPKGWGNIVGEDGEWLVRRGGGDACFGIPDQHATSCSSPWRGACADFPVLVW
jgi:hypothetical protein